MVRWDPDAAVTAFGPVTYFIEFLKANGLWQEWVKDCPLAYRSPNAPPKQDILGTILLSVLAGHKRYAHVTTMRSDSVLPGLLGMTRVRSEDAVRRAFQSGAGLRRLDACASGQQLRRVAEGALDSGRGRDGEAAVRQAGAGRAGLQPDQDGAAVARLSDLHHRFGPDGVGGGSAGRQPDGLAVCAARLMGVAGEAAAPAMAEADSGRRQLGGRSE